MRSAALVSQLPVTGRGIGAWFNRLDRPFPPGTNPTGEAYRVITPAYFETVGISLKKGRALEMTDTRDAPVVVVNEALVRKYYQGEEPLGKPIYLGAPDNRLFEQASIVGVVSDTRDGGLGNAPLPTVYIPAAVMPTWNAFSFVVRTQPSPGAIAPSVRAAIHEVDATLAIRDIRTMDEVLSTAVAPACCSCVAASPSASRGRCC